jgi:hypothetical protein
MYGVRFFYLFSILMYEFVCSKQFKAVYFNSLYFSYFCADQIANDNHYQTRSVCS